MWILGLKGLTVSSLYNGNMGDRRKWPLQRGFKQESMYQFFCPPGRKKVAVIER